MVLCKEHARAYKEEEFFVRFLPQRNEYVYLNTLALDRPGKKVPEDFDGGYHNEALAITYGPGAPHHAILNHHERWVWIRFAFTGLDIRVTI